MKLKGWQIQALGISLLLLLSFIAIPFFAQRISSQLHQHVSTSLKQQGYHWTSVSVEGRDITLTGNAPNQQTSNAVFNTAKKNSSIASITNNMTPRLIQPYTITLSWDGQALAINGYVPDQESYNQLVSNSQKHFGDSMVYGDLKIGAGAPQSWSELVNSSVQSLAKLQQGRFEITDNSVYLAGKTPYLSVREAIISSLSHYQHIQSTVHIVAADEADKMCQQKFDQLLADNTIQFTINKAVIERSSDSLLTKLANVAALCPKSHILIEGHTDSQGSEGANMQLSQKRAQATVSWLFQQGISIERLTAVGHGERKPIGNNATESGRGINRRIEFTVKPQVVKSP